MEGDNSSKLLSQLYENYTGKRNNYSWLVTIWAILAVGSKSLLPIQAALIQSFLLAAGWIAMHIIHLM